MALIQQQKKENKQKLHNKRKDLKELKIELTKDKKTELLTLKSLNNLVNKDFQLVSVQDQANLEELMDIFYKENNLNSMQRKLNQERNDFNCK